MPNDIPSLITRLETFRARSLDGMGKGLDEVCGEVTDEMRQTTVHGNVTYATRSSYNARRVGRGELGIAKFEASVAAVESLNPDHVGVAPVDVPGELGAIIDSATDYQWQLETEYAGEKAVLGPTLQRWALLFTAAAAVGSTEGLGT